MIRPEMTAVVPAHAAEAHVARALQSLLDQHLSPGAMEIIVVDDGSPDRTAEIARATLQRSPYAWQIVANAQARGAAGARNQGLNLARGEWLQFLDADDELVPGKLRAQLAQARVAPDKTAVIYSEFRREPGRAVHFPAVAAAVDPLTSLLAGDGFIQIGAQLVRRQAALAIGGFDPAFKHIEDVDFLQRLLMTGHRLEALALGAPGLIFHQGAQTVARPTTPAFHDEVSRSLATAETMWRRNGLTALQAEVLVQGYAMCIRKAPSEDLGKRLDALGPTRGKLGWLARLLGHYDAARVLSRLRPTFAPSAAASRAGS